MRNMCAKLARTLVIRSIRKPPPFFGHEDVPQ